MFPSTFRRLEVFITVVDAGSFVAAADQLGISHPSVSNHIRALERQVRCELFARRRGTVSSLTEQGRRLYERGVELLEQADRLSHDLSLNQRPVAKKQVIKVASQRSVAAGWLCRPLAKFARDKTDVEFLVEVGRYELIINAMLEGKADIGFLLSFGPIIDFPSELIGREEFAFFTSPNHPLAGRASVSVSELVAHPFITTKRESRFGQMVHNMLDAAGVRGYQALHQIQEGTIVQELAILGLGVFCGPARLAMGHVHAGALVKIPLQALELYMDVHYIMSPRQRQRQDRLTASFVDFLKQYHG